MTCACGTENANGARFCLSCGASLQATSGVATIPPPVPRVENTARGLRRYSTLIGIAIVVVGIVGYQLFVKQDPERDGKRAATGYCDCAVASNDAAIAAVEEYSKAFPGKGFTRRADAARALQDARNAAGVKAQECRNTAAAQLATLRGRYRTNQEELATFEFALNGQQGSCTPPNQARADRVDVQAQALIDGIVDPEPGVEQMKADLIGKQIPGWRFDFLNEFTGAKVLETTRAANRVDYRVLFNLKGANENDLHDAEVMIAYVLDQTGWKFERVRARSITYDSLISPEEWTAVTPLNGCAFHVADDKKLTWKTWDFTPEVHSGPDAPNVTIPSSGRYLIKSREGAPVLVRFTYTDCRQ